MEMAEANLEQAIKNGVEKALNTPVVDGKSIMEWAAIGMKASRWVSVNERLPMPNHVVLVYVHNRKIGYSYRLTSWLSNDRKWEGNSDIFNDDDVTHWTELPEPPKEEE
jgi:hypothetical protein